MLKNEEFMYEGENYKVINPRKGLREEIVEKIEQFTDEEGNLNIDDANFKLYLLQLLVVSEDEDYNFLTKSLEDVEEIEKDPSFEYEQILYFIGSILSDLIIMTYRAKILELKQAHIQVLQNQTSEMIENITGDLNLMVRTDKRINDEKRINEIRAEQGFDKLDEPVGKTSKIKNIFKKK